LKATVRESGGEPLLNRSKLSISQTCIAKIGNPHAKSKSIEILKTQIRPQRRPDENSPQF